jgi:hypothetical protein
LINDVHMLARAATSLPGAGVAELPTARGRMMITQLEPPLFMGPPGGRAFAHVLGDHAPEAHPMRVCFLKADAQRWTVAKPALRIRNTRSLQGRCATPRAVQP